jgi:hypothetical protein
VVEIVYIYIENEGCVGICADWWVLKISWCAKAEVVRLASASLTLSLRKHECSYQRPILWPTLRLLQDTRSNNILYSNGLNVYALVGSLKLYVCDIDARIQR